MIAEVFPTVYDGTGEPVARLTGRRYRYFAPNAPMDRYVAEPLTVVCRDIEEIRRFLQSCRYVPDERQFGVRDYWLLPEEFERRRAGDCEDFAVWTWRQLLRLGYDARFVCGRGAGLFRGGHAWVAFNRDGRTFIVESLFSSLGPTFPRLMTLRYRPQLSVSWNGRDLGYFEHPLVDKWPSLFDVARSVPEWAAYVLRGGLRSQRRRLA